MEIKPYEHKVQYYETDKMGIVHHSNYIRWFEEARVDFLDQAGCSYEKMEAEGIICPVVSVDCQYHHMTCFGESVYIFPQIVKFNGVRLVIHYKVREKQTGELRSSGSSSHCYLDGEGHLVNLKNASPAFYKLYKEAPGFTYVNPF